MEDASPATHTVSLKGWLVFILLAFIWGGSFILIKKGLLHFAPQEVGALRIGLSALAFIPVFILSGVRFPRKDIVPVTLIALTGNGIPAFLYAAAQTRLGSGVTGVLNSLTPIFALLFGVLFFGIRLRPFHALGLFLGCAGLTTLVLSEQDWRVSSFVLLIVVATGCYGLSANLVKRYAQHIPPIALTSAGFFVLGSILWPFLIAGGTVGKILEPSAWSVSMPALLALALVCTVLANVLFYWLIQQTSVIFGSAIAYAIPCMALVWGSLDGERITATHLLGFALIVGAVYTLRRK
jgi:drug/metabolite transporter (DMT)-like permease